MKYSDSDEEVENNDLALLVMDERDNNQHFNFKSIVEEEAQVNFIKYFIFLKYDKPSIINS